MNKNKQIKQIFPSFHTLQRKSVQRSLSLLPSLLCPSMTKIKLYRYFIFCKIAQQQLEGLLWLQERVNYFFLFLREIKSMFSFFLLSFSLSAKITVMGILIYHTSADTKFLSNVPFIFSGNAKDLDIYTQMSVFACVVKNSLRRMKKNHCLPYHK